MELLKDYGMSILYDSAKVIVIVDALSILSMGITVMLRNARKNWLKKFIDLPDPESVYYIPVKVELW